MLSTVYSTSPANLSNHTLIKAFFQVINRQNEEPVYSTFVLKKNRHGKIDRRFLVTTKAVLYLCSQIKIIKSIKITRQLAWVDLQKITFEDPDHFTFTFKTDELNLIVESPKEFIEVILTNIYYLFGNNLPFELQISPLVVKPPEKMSRFPFSCLFLSFCHSMGLPENDILFNSLNTKSQKNPEYLCIDLTKLKYDLKYQPAILSTLKYAYNIRSLRISGETTPDSETIFQVLSQTIKNNSQCLYSLTLLNCATFTGFSDFCESILNSYLCKICFDGIIFKTKIFSQFVDILPQSAIEKIQFIRCPLKEKIIKLIKVKASNFSKLRSISINNTDFLKDKNNLKLFFDFLKEAKISIIELVNDRIDIADIFYSLSQTEIPITSLNVSENYCSSKFSGQYILPVTLENIKLTGVNWSPTALFNLLTSQSYVNMVQLDISNQLEANGSFDGIGSDSSDPDADSKLNEFALLEMHRALKPAGNMNINSLIWNYNMLSNGFFAYITQLKNLEKLSIDCCLCDPNETISIQNDLVLYLQYSNLKELSIKGPDSPYKSLLKGLFAVISAHESLRALDVSDNGIGDEGLEMVVDCLSKNKNIERIAFDGSKLQKPQKFIDCCNRLSELENLKYVAEPTKDMENLKTQEELLKITPGKVENAWERLKAKLDERNKRINGDEIVDENDISDDEFNINLYRFNGDYFSSVSSTAALPIKQNVQKASWKIEIDVPFDKESNSWETMGEQFSLQALTGIRPDNQDSLILL